MSDTKDELLNKIDKLLERHSPDDKTPCSNSPSWQQRPYRDDFFDLCMKAVQPFPVKGRASINLLASVTPGMAMSNENHSKHNFTS